MEYHAMRLTAFLILSLSIIVLSACATYPQSQIQKDPAAYYANVAKEAIAKGDTSAAKYYIEYTLTLPTGYARIKEMFDSYPEGRNWYCTDLEKRIANISSANEAVSMFEKLTAAKSAGIFTEIQTSDLFTNLSKVVVEGNRTGSVPFNLGDTIDSFPELKSSAHQQIIIDRSIKILQTNVSGYRPVAALMDYVQRVGINSAEGKRIETLLPTMNIRRDELDPVGKLFPKFVAARKDEITARVFVQFKNGDRLFTDDVLQTLYSRIRGVEWVTSAGPKTTTIIIERVRHDERTIPERSQTITYAYTEVNMLGATLLMPVNASYLYEVVSGGAEIEYGYVVSAIVEGKTIFDEVILGKVAGEYRRCENARIQNVFGGVTSAGFIANADMQQRCSGPSSVLMEDLRRDVLSMIVDSVLKVPPIQQAQ